MTANWKTSRMNLTRIPVLAPAVVILIMAGSAAGQPQQRRKVTKAKPEQTQKQKPASQVVHFETSDGVRIEADYFPPDVPRGQTAPVAILIHMYPADRTSWKPLIPHLHKSGFAVLAYDIRGTGGSIRPVEKKLGKLYKGQNAKHFNNAWRDTQAAKAWLADRPECDTKRIALIGASIGCSISLHYGSKDEDAKAIVCLSPGTDYMKVDSIAHIKQCGKRAILLMSPEAEYGRVRKLIEASGGVADGKMFPGGSDRHGTWMFDAPYGGKVKQRIVKFVRKAMAGKA